MAGSVNKVVLIGNLGKDPEIRSTQSGARIASFSIATSESWKDKNTGERKENTQWHRIVIFNDALVGVAERFLKKGSKVYIEGQLENRKWAGDDGRDNFVTEVVLRQFKGEITLLDKLSGDDDSSERQPARSSGSRSPAVQSQPINDVLDDDIPF